MAADRESRIAARRARIAARLRAAKASPTTDATIEGTHEDTRFNVVKTHGFSTTLVKAQLKERVMTLQNLAHDRTFNNLSLNGTRHKSLETLMSEENDFSAAVEEVTRSRDELLSIKVPQELFRKSNDLCKAYESMVDSKAKVIKGIYDELKLKDDEYNLSIKQQSQAVNELLAVMSQQVVQLRDLYLKELDDAENTLLLERKSLLDSNKSEMTILIQERQDKESDYHDEIYICKEKFMKLLNDIRDDDIEEYNALKIKLEKDAQNLEQHLQNMQAVYQLNVEKLEYNFLVLTERERENYIMSNQQKKKLTKQRDSLSHIKGRHHELEKQFTEHNERATDDYIRVTKLLQDLQRKQQNLQSIHASIYRRFFFMHQHTISSLVSRVLQADKQIHEQELGWHWRSPNKDLFVTLDRQDPLEEANAKQDKDPLMRQKSIPCPLMESLAKDRYKIFMESLINEAGFLVDKESTKALIDVDPKLHQRAWCALILNALGVDNTTTLEKLYMFLMEKMSENQTISVSQIKAYLQSEKILQEHISEHDKRLKQQHSLLTVGTHRAKAMFMKRNWEKYWMSFTTIISPRVLRMWKHLESALISYNQILKDRLFVSKEVIQLRQRNQKLQETLQYCLSSREILN